MFDLSTFKKHLAETIYWCAPRIKIDDLEHSLRTLLPRDVDELINSDLVMGLAPHITKLRSTMIEALHEILGHYQPPPILPLGLEKGRLFIVYPDWNIYDPAASAVTNGFFNSVTIPAWDTWIHCGAEEVILTNSQARTIQHLICWAPPQVIDLIDDAINVDPTECIEWLADTKFKFSFLPLLKAEELLT